MVAKGKQSIGERVFLRLNVVAQFDPTREILPDPDTQMIDRLSAFSCVGGGVYPFLVSWPICLINSKNKRNFGLLNIDAPTTSTERSF